MEKIQKSLFSKVVPGQKKIVNVVNVSQSCV